MTFENSRDYVKQGLQKSLRNPVKNWMRVENIYLSTCIFTGSLWWFSVKRPLIERHQSRLEWLNCMMFLNISQWLQQLARIPDSFWRGHVALLCWEGSGVFWSHHMKYSADLLSFHTVELLSVFLKKS